MRGSRERGGFQGHPQRQRPGGIGSRKPSGSAGTKDVDLEWLQAMESVWPDWDPPPALHPDHPSAPLPRIDDALEGPPSGRQQRAAHPGSGRRAPPDEPELPLWLAQRVLSEADEQAAVILTTARREAAAIVQQASDEAAATRAAADRDAAQMRAAVMTMSAELGDIAAHVTQSLTTNQGS
jgi:hypothetical protein